MLTAPLPAGIDGHFGPELRRFVLAQYHQGQMTVPRSGDAVAQPRHLHLQAPSGPPADRGPGRLSRRGPRRAACRAFERRPGSRWTTPALATRPAMASARRWAMPTSPGSAPPAARAGSISSNCCAPATTTTSSMPRRWITCANAPFPAQVIARLARASGAVASPIAGAWTAHLEGARHLGPQGQSGPCDDRDRGGAVGQRQGARLPARHRDRQR